MNWNSSVGIAARLHAGWPENWRSIPRRVEFSVLHSFHTSSGAHQAGTGGSFSQDKTMECEADLLPPSTAKIQNVWSYTSFLPQYVFMTWCLFKPEVQLSLFQDSFCYLINEATLCICRSVKNWNFTKSLEVPRLHIPFTVIRPWNQFSFFKYCCQCLRCYHWLDFHYAIVRLDFLHCLRHVNAFEAWI
jgi:hypothetical protein